MSWPTAHRVAHIAAVQAHHDLQVAPDRFPVEIESAIRRAGVTLMWRPMDQLFGTYMRVGDVRGILVNERLTRSGRRHTAAHELGHHRFGHQLAPGSVCAVDAAEGPPRPRPWTVDEQAAEAFSDWFLMPLKAVRMALSSLGLDRPDGPASLYQLSLLLGTTYRATTRHCVSLRLASRADGQAWAKVSPGALKQRLMVQPLSSTRDLDVWWMGQPLRAGQPTERHLSPGDLVVVPRRLLVDSGGLPTAENREGQVVITAPRHGTYTLQLAGVGGEVVALQLVVQPRPHGLHMSGDPDWLLADRGVTA